MTDLKIKSINEETVKNNIVLAWLKKELGFKEEDLTFEESFTINFGRSNKPIKSIYDILVTDKLTHKNLFIIEVKKEGLNLGNDVRDQGISYARLTHPVTPFVITTNGKDCKLYETITKKELNDKDKVFIKGYEVSINMDEYYEALKYLIGLNENNLKEFLKHEYSLNTKQLIAKSIDDEKSYYPQLFEPHPDLENCFEDFTKSNKRAFSVIAHSGMGKTCWMCYKANELIKKNNFVFFLRFADIRSGIFETIVNDLNWNPNFRIIASAQEGQKKLDKLIGEKPLYIFVDGLDEGSHTDKGIILEEFIKHSDEKINYRLIVSCKSYYWNNFEKYHSEPSRLFDNLYKQRSSKYIEDLQVREVNAFLLDELADSQLDKMVKNYKSTYSYTKRIAQKSLDEFKKNPYLFRIAFSILLADNNYVIDSTSRDLIEKYFDSIIKRFKNRNFGEYELMTLFKISDCIFKQNKDRISINSIINEIGNIPDVLFRSNILIKTEIDAFSSEIEFYFSKLRDFIIAFKIENFDDKDENYFREYKRDFTNVRNEVLTTYFSITNSNNQKKICGTAYKKANSFLKKRIEAIEKDYSNFKEAFEPFTAGSIAIVTNVDLQDERCATYSYKEKLPDEDSVIMEASSSADLFQAAINKYDISSMHYCNDLDEEFIEEELQSSIYEIIDLNLHRNYYRSLNISHNKNILIERLLLLVLKNYKKIFNRKITHYHPSSQFLPLNLTELKGKIESVDKNEDMKLILLYIERLNALNLIVIDSPIIKDWGTSHTPKKFTFSNYHKAELQNIVVKLYKMFLDEYRTFIETNFATLREEFPFVNTMTNKIILIVNPSDSRVIIISMKSSNPDIRCILEKFKNVRDKTWKYSYQKMEKKYGNIEYSVDHLSNLFKTSGDIAFLDIPDYFDTLNQFIHKKLRSDLDEYYKQNDREKIDSFKFDNKAVSEEELEVFQKICEYSLKVNEITHLETRLIPLLDKRDELSSLNKKGFFSSYKMNMLGSTIWLSINSNSFYYYLQTCKANFSISESTIIKKLKEYDKYPKPHISSKDLSEELGIDSVIVESILYQLEKDKIVKGSLTLNGNYWIYEIDKEKLDDFL